MDTQEMEYPQDATDNIEVGDGMTFTAHIKESAFNKLMLKLFDTLIKAVDDTSADLATGDEWGEFLSSTEILHNRK
jgi:hypothetical protein